jgi:hypothetical protein
VTRFLLLVALSGVLAASTPASAAVRHRPPHAAKARYKATDWPHGRVTYRGYAWGFPPPAYLHYGYPGSGYASGLGF